MGRKYVLPVAWAVHPPVYCPQRDFLRGVPVVVGDAVFPGCGIVETAEGKVFGSRMYLVADKNFTRKSALPVAIAKGLALGGVVIEKIPVCHVAAVFRRDPRQGIVPGQRLQAMFFSVLVDLLVNAFGKIGGLNLGLRFLLLRRDVGIHGAEDNCSRK